MQQVRPPTTASAGESPFILPRRGSAKNSNPHGNEGTRMKKFPPPYRGFSVFSMEKGENPVKFTLPKSRGVFPKAVPEGETESQDTQPSSHSDPATHSRRNRHKKQLRFNQTIHQQF